MEKTRSPVIHIDERVAPLRESRHLSIAKRIQIHESPPLLSVTDILAMVRGPAFRNGGDQLTFMNTKGVRPKIWNKFRFESLDLLLTGRPIGTVGLNVPIQT